MIPEDNTNEQNRKLKEMNYSPNEDLFNKEKHISLDGDGNPIINEQDEENEMEMDLDVLGSDEDNDMEEIGSEDEENNYWSTSDNNDDHEEENDDVLT
jgi:nitrogenase molybdenum-iron protein alpha/beta subunit